MKKKFVVNVEKMSVKPMVVEAENEWEAMILANNGEGSIHEMGVLEYFTDPKNWEVNTLIGLNFYPRKEA